MLSGSRYLHYVQLTTYNLKHTSQNYGAQDCVPPEPDIVAVLPRAGSRDSLRNSGAAGERCLTSVQDKKQSEIARLIADLRSAQVELLSAQCGADRLRRQYSLQDIVTFGERQTLKKAIASADALHRFFSLIGAQIQREEEGD